jgi:hypothetical protein
LRPNQGKSFGLPHSVYQKVYLPGSKCTTTTLEAPGPGNYEIKTLVGSQARKFSMYQKVKPILPSAVENPPPNSYHLNYNLS